MGSQCQFPGRFIGAKYTNELRCRQIHARSPCVLTEEAQVRGNRLFKLKLLFAANGKFMLSHHR